MLFRETVALLFSVCQNRTLLDGHKRLARVGRCGVPGPHWTPRPDIDVDAAETFMLSGAGGRLNDVAEIEKAHRDLYPPQPIAHDCQPQIGREARQHRQNNRYGYCKHGPHRLTRAWV